MERRGRPAGGFTLIELLVVISIILLLAALALPVLNQAARQGRTVRCIADIKQLGTAFFAYAQGHDSMLPNMYHYYERDGSVSRTPTWLQSYPRTMEDCPKAGQLWPYYRDEKLVLCPSDREGNGVFSYSSPVFVSHRMVEQAENTSEALLLLCEHEKYHIGYGSVEGGFGSIDRPSVRHGQRTPTGYFDGQARLVEYPVGFIAYDVEIEPWGYNDYFHTP